MTRSLPAFALVLTLAAGTATPLAAPQESNKTQAMAKQLTDLMQAQKLDAIATRTGEDHFAAILFIPGVQMLVVSARYTAPALLNEKILGRQYRDVYLDLASASVPDSKLFIEDMQADGLRARARRRNPLRHRHQGRRRRLHLRRRPQEEEDLGRRVPPDLRGLRRRVREDPGRPDRASQEIVDGCQVGNIVNLGIRLSDVSFRAYWPC